MVIYAVIAYLLVYFCHSNAGEDSSIPYASYGSYPIVGHLFHFLHDRTKFLMNCKQRYGRCFKIRLVNERLTFVLAPYDWATIIRNQSFYLPSLVNIIHMFGVSNTLLSRYHICYNYNEFEKISIFERSSRI